jgi:hypothetical protein
MQTREQRWERWLRSSSSRPDEHGFVDFGDVSRDLLGLQCQYGSRYVDGRIEGWENLGDGLRFQGNTNNYHSLRIHREDVEEFVSRHQKLHNL